MPAECFCSLRRPGLARLGLFFVLACAGWPAPASQPARACQVTSGQILRIWIPSQVYQNPVPVSLYLPPCYAEGTRPLPVIYLLHGGGADETQWPDLRVQPEADALIARGAPPFVVVMPGGDYIEGQDYAAFVLTDLLPAIERRFRVRAARRGRAIGGLSLGGYWALKIAFQHPDMFVAAGGHSPVVTQGGADDPLPLARTAPGLDRLHISLDVGQADSLREETARLASALQARGLAVSLGVNPGGHSRAYWRSHTAEYLDFYLRALSASDHPRACRGGAQPLPPGPCPPPDSTPKRNAHVDAD